MRYYTNKLIDIFVFGHIMSIIKYNKDNFEKLF